LNLLFGNAWTKCSIIGKKKPGDLESINALEALVTLAQVPPIKVDLWKAQNAYYELLQAIFDGKHLSGNNQWLDRFLLLGERLGIAPSQLVSIPAFNCDEVQLSRLRRPWSSQARRLKHRQVN
jgi:hypothetical protein